MDIKAFLRTNTTIHLALVAGVTVFLIYSYLQSEEINAEMDSSNPFLYLVPIFAIVGYFGSQFIFKKMISSVNKDVSLENKLKTYQTASIIKYALLEGPAFFAIVAYSLTGNALPLVIAICLVLYLAVQRPNLHKLMDTLPLTSDEKRKLQHNQ
ncbi:hypothetical protein CJ263_19815 [Maribacter cobaltidurans]|uniref:Uncharacterized protein n=2 Tax=Maribacter cobaltidurans TaxID=1178778 RepID=A0A223VAV4_9FLAO|nr:hypothetical protein CJ263_19815 [Maribacter cobaltidurans]GGD94923.1 hypothetical protein GCM10011412_36230 [Maribacter cobaltidurans]